MKKLLELLCGTLAGTALFAIMALTFSDVLGRKLLDHSIPGSLEMTELLMVIVIFGAMPLVSLRGEHVVFDTLDDHIAPWLLRIQKVLIDALCGAALLGLAWLMWRTGNQFMQNGETTAQLTILKAPFIYGMGVLCGLTGLVHLALMFRPPAQLQDGEGMAL